MANTYAYNPFTRKLDIVGATVIVDTSPGGSTDVWLLEATVSGWLLEDGTSFWVIE